MAKVGEGHFSAWLRQGLRELRAVFYPESNVAQQPEYGLYGTRTPGEVAEARRDVVHDLEDERSASVVDEWSRGGKPRDDPSQDRGLER